MSSYKKIEKFQDVVKSTNHADQNRLILYSKRLENKLTQTEYALLKIQQKATSIDISTTIKTISGKSITIDYELYFYLDSFWAFLYSCLMENKLERRLLQ
jgi:hypothetical protein